MGSSKLHIIFRHFRLKVVKITPYLSCTTNCYTGLVHVYRLQVIKKTYTCVRIIYFAKSQFLCFFGVYGMHI